MATLTLCVPCRVQRQSQHDLLGGGHTQEQKALSRRECVRRNQHRFRIRQKERQKDADEQVAQLTAELEASRIGQVVTACRHSSQRSGFGLCYQYSKP